MNPLYNLGIRIYATAAKMAAHSNGKIAKMVAGQRQTLAKLKQCDYEKRNPVWIHAASLGEFEQARPLIELIAEKHPEIPVVLSFFSPSGYDVRKDYPLADSVVYLPFDTPGNAKKFIAAIHPRLAIFVKYEFWGNYLEQLRKQQIPTAIISAIFRPGQVFFKPWGFTFRKMLKAFSAGIFVQDKASQLLLEKIGVKSEVCGDTRFDRVLSIMKQTANFPAIEKFTKSGKTLIMGSSWQPDEDAVIPYFNHHPEMKLIIAPHEFDEERLAALEKKIKRPVKRYSQLQPGEDIDADCLIIDCFGILSSCYRYADIAYIGGGFGAGIHNINEAAVYNMPVIFGPKYHKFKEARDLVDAGGAKVITSADDFSSVMTVWLTNSAYLENAGNIAGKYIKENIGATEKIYNRIKYYL
ncbi:MAG: 3-deoxy-D-manno-octulosonic acid transferase [Muribaculaceae bacterium]|nr:3-deoxy-D-manno-octulosonic acid transferase [Muribaculaceae bacterium]